MSRQENIVDSPQKINHSMINTRCVLAHGIEPDRVPRRTTSYRQVMLSTLDNPFDPFTQFNSWFAFDESKNYHSCSYLARIARTSDELSDEDNEVAIEQAIDEIVKLNVLGIYKKVVRTG